MCVGGLNKAGNGWLDSDTLPLRLCMVASEAVSDRLIAYTLKDGPEGRE